MRIAQWSPLFFAMWTLPWLAVFAVVKPNAGAAVIEAKPRWTANILAASSAALLTVIAFLVQPTWFSEWLALVRSPTYFSVPLLRPGGFLLALALLRWRRPEARLLLFLSCIPVTPSYYENLLLFLVALTGPEIMALVGLAYVMDALFVTGPFATWGELFSAQGHAAVWFLYLLALAMVLRRPNEGAVATSVERMASRLPSWIRGQRQARAM